MNSWRGIKTKNVMMILKKKKHCPLKSLENVKEKKETKKKNNN